MTMTTESRLGSDRIRAWEGFVDGPWRTASTSATSSSATTRPYTGDAAFLAGPTARTTAMWDAAHRDVPRRARARASTTSTRTRRRRITVARARLHRPGQRAHRRPADRRPAQARDHAQRRLADGRERAARPTATQPDPTVKEIFTKYRKTHNDGRLRRLPAARPRRPLARTSSPACRTPTAAAGSSATTAASRCTASTRLIAAKQADRAALDTAALHRGRHPRPRGELPSRSARWASSRQMAASLRLRHLRPGDHRAARPSSGCTSPTSPR